MMTCARAGQQVALLLLVQFVFTSGSRGADWQKINDGATGSRNAPAALWAPDMKRILLVSGETAEGSATVMAFDPQAGTWAEISRERPKVERQEYFNISSRAAYSAKAHSIYALPWDGNNDKWGELFQFDLATKKWVTIGASPLLEGLSFCSMICDEPRGRLVIVGSDKVPGNLGYMRGVAFDIAAGKWSSMPFPPAEVIAAHQRRKALHGEMSAAVGRTRLAWYRDPEGAGTLVERQEIGAILQKLLDSPEATGVSVYLKEGLAALNAGKSLETIQHLKRAVRQFEDLMDEAYPVPRSRRNSPLAYAPTANTAVLFGGDHLDYLMNDTWVLDLSKDTWRRAKPKSAPAPRAGHAMVFLPKSGRFAMYEGFTLEPWEKTPLTLWLFDPGSESWDMVHSGPPTGEPPLVGRYYGYAQEQFAFPALAADDNDQLVLEVPGDASPGRPQDARRSATWALNVSKLKPIENTISNTAAPNTRARREGPYVTDFCEVDEKPKTIDLKALAANRWVQLPAPPRNPMLERPRSWNTAIFDARNDQVLMWGGGHSVPSANSVAHWSPVSNRIVEAYDAEVPNRGIGMGYGAHGSSLNNRPWIPAHTYRLYCWDAQSGLMVFMCGRALYFYDPVRMDWLPTSRPVPFQANYNFTLSATTPHGIAVWTQTDSEPGLWIIDLSKGVEGLVVRKVDVTGAKLPPNLVDRDGMTYDGRKDRLILHCPGDDTKREPGRLLAVSLKDGKVQSLAAPPADIAAMRCVREMAYVAHTDWVIYNQPYDRKHEETGPGSIYRIYDCAKDKWFLIDLGPGPTGMSVVQGIFYDAKRELVFVMNQNGSVWALKLDPTSAKLMSAPPPPRAEK